MATNKYANVTFGTAEAVFNKLGGIKGIEAFLRDETKIIPNEVAVKQAFPVSTLVHVDRSMKPTYHDFVYKVLHPELESTGLPEYDIVNDMLMWLHNKQHYGEQTGLIIYDYLKKNRMLESCGNLQDALAIQQLGGAAFKKAFGHKVVYFWKSVVQCRDDTLEVPCLFEHRDEVVIHWQCLDNIWYDNEPAVRFASN